LAKHLLKITVFISAPTCAILAAAFWGLIGAPAAAALVINACAGLASLFHLAKDIERIIVENSPRKFYAVRFSLRFAAFAVWLYITIAVLRFHFIPVLTGLTLPAFSFAAAAFFDTLKKR
jgi:hypothetical protein